MYDFANILFSGPCSARCDFCIGRQVAPELNQPNLDIFPPRNLDAFLDLVIRRGIRQVVLTGTNTDPQLYRYEALLLALLRARLPSETQLSLHTNARQALEKMDVFNQYDRAALSIPSFDEIVYRQMMGVTRPPDLAEILRQARIPIKISCLVERRSAPGLSAFLWRCQQLGVRRVVLRKLYGSHEPLSAWLDPAALGLLLSGEYRGNPVYALDGMEVTLWDFGETESTSLNLFANGQISAKYRLAETR